MTDIDFTLVEFVGQQHTDLLEFVRTHDCTDLERLTMLATFALLAINAGIVKPDELVASLLHAVNLQVQDGELVEMPTH